LTRGEQIRFGSVFTQKTNQNQILKNLKIQTGTGFGSVRFGFFIRKTGKPVLLFFWAFWAFSGFLMGFLMGL
jgi:hypothetical protein